MRRTLKRNEELITFKRAVREVLGRYDLAPTEHPEDDHVAAVNALNEIRGMVGGPFESSSTEKARR